MFQPQATPYSSFTSYGPPPSQSQPQSQSTCYTQAPNVNSVTGGPIVFDNPIFGPVGGSGFPPITSTLPNLNHGAYNATSTMEPQPQSDDLIAQEALARDYRPEAQGPLVGNKRSTLAITEEYAKGDPTFIAKTQALPQTYSHYRPVKGDGNCGWRAIAFCWMETLLELHDEKLLQDEITRMRNLTNYVVESGYELWIFEDMRDECLETLQACTTLLDLPASQAEAELLRMFNKQDTSDAIVYWLRLLTCAHFREHAARFEPYVPELAGVDAYCKENLEPPYTEIEHLGLTALMEVLLDPIGVGVQINYLDRTPGPEMNHYNLAPKSTARSTIQLLYRPGHYDLLYKISEQASARRQMSEHQILNAASAQSNMQVNRATSFSQQHQIQSTPADYYGTSLGYLLSLPQLSGPLPAFTGFQTQGFVPESTPYGLSSQTASSYSMDYPKSMSPEAAAPTPDNLTQLPPASITSLPPIDVRPLTLNTRDTTISLSPLSPTTITNPTKPRLQSPSANTPTPTLPPPLTRISSHDSQQSQFRPSMYQYKDDWGEISAHQQPVFQTSTFKNSHYNVSHYNNPNFQPEVWTPGQEGEERDERGRSGRRGTS